MFSEQDRINARTQAARARLARKQSVNERTVILEGGAWVYPDSLPGVGWVLLSPTGHKRYYRSKELAVEQWVTKWLLVEHRDLIKKSKSSKGSPKVPRGNKVAGTEVV